MRLRPLRCLLSIPVILSARSSRPRRTIVSSIFESRPTLISTIFRDSLLNADKSSKNISPRPLRRPPESLESHLRIYLSCLFTSEDSVLRGTKKPGENRASFVLCELFYSIACCERVFLQPLQGGFDDVLYLRSRIVFEDGGHNFGDVGLGEAQHNQGRCGFVHQSVGVCFE